MKIRQHTNPADNLPMSSRPDSFLRTLAVRRRVERGSALVPVLCLILLSSLLVASILAMSQYNAYTAKAHVAQQRSLYELEGALNRVFFLTSAENSRYPSFHFRTFRYSDYDFDRYLTDGVPHEMNYHGRTMVFRLTNPYGGLNFSSSRYQNTLEQLRRNRTSDTEYQERLTVLRALLQDYTDNNDDTRENGRDTEDYELSGMAPLPSNRPFQYREEFFYIPELLALAPPDRYGRPSSFAIAQPSVQQNSMLPTLYDAPDLWLATACNLSDSEIDAVRAALRLVRTQRAALSDALDDALLTKLQQSSMLRWQPSGGFTVTLEADSSEPHKRLQATFFPRGSAGAISGLTTFCEWLFF